MFKQKLLYLILAIVCFIGIILIFVFDGYMGLYDTLTSTSGEQTQTVTFQTWDESERYNYLPQIYPNSGDVLTFEYQIDNRRFSAYKADVSISIWKNQEKVQDVLSQSINVSAFGKETITWETNTLDVTSDNISMDSQYTLQISRGDVLRKIIIYLPAKIINIKTPAEAAVQ